MASTAAVTTSNDFDYFFTTQPPQPVVTDTTPVVTVTSSPPSETTPKQEDTTPKPEITTPQPVVTTKHIPEDTDDNALIDDNGIICPTYTRNSATNTAWSHADWVKSFKGLGANTVTDK